MSQEEIIEILKDRQLTRKEIQELTDLAQQSVSYALKQLVKYNEIIKEYSDSNIPLYKIKKKK